MRIDDDRRPAMAALQAARLALRDARARVWSGSPAARGTLEDAARRYRRAIELARSQKRSSSDVEVVPPQEASEGPASGTRRLVPRRQIVTTSRQPRHRQVPLPSAPIGTHVAVEGSKPQ